MNNFHATSFKQWKQQVQFELEGADYNKTLVFKTLQEVDILPIYTSENNHLYYDINDKKTEIMIPVECFSVIPVVKKINFFKKHHFSNFFLSIHPHIDIADLLNTLPKENTYFINNKHITDEVINKLKKCIEECKLDIVVCNDYIHRYIEKGMWFRSQSNDFECFTKTFNIKKPVLFVDTTLYQNAGASIIQQIAYGISHALEYSKHIEKTLNINRLTIYFKIAVGSHFLLEIAKLRAFHQIAMSIFDVFPFKIECMFMVEPSDRELSLSTSNYNEQYIKMAHESAILGGADFLFPKYPIIYHKKKEYQQEFKSIMTASDSLGNKASIINKSDCFQSLSYQFAKKSLLLLQNIEKNGGLLEVFKNGSLQKSIREKALEEQEQFDALVISNNIDFKDIAQKELWETYPFLKRNNTKTSVEPLIPKRLWEHLEKKHLSK